MNTLGIVVLWVLAVGLLGFAALGWVAGEAERSATGSTGSRRWLGIAALAGAVLVALLLTGCSTPTVVKDRIVEVKIPVAIQPITPEQVPSPPAPLGPRPGNISAAADMLLAKWCEAVGYMLRADPLLHISAGQQPGPMLDYPECRPR